MSEGGIGWLGGRFPGGTGGAAGIVGVTDGSDAQRGQIGEYVEFQVQTTYSGALNESQHVVAGTLQPGDWDCWAFGEASASIFDISFHLDPLIPGMNALRAGGTGEWVLVTTVGRVSSAVPVEIGFTVVTNQSNAGTQGGTFYIVFCARRMR